MSSGDSRAGTLTPDTIRVNGRDTAIGPDGVIVGRGEDCAVQLDSQKASRHHARIFVDASGCWVQDLGSTNGTFVGGKRLQGAPRALANGDHVVVGEFDLIVLAGEKTRFQAVLTRTAEGAVLRDLNSRNGTRVGGELVSRVALAPGAEVAVGGYR